MGIATTKSAYVATAFNEAGVLHYCREGMHAEYLLNGVLFNQGRKDITDDSLAQANAVTDNICKQLKQLSICLANENIGIHPLNLEWQQ